MSLKWIKIWVSLLAVLSAIPVVALAEANLPETQHISNWHKTDYSQTRLHILQANKQNISLAVEINIIKNYKTYWLSPGSSGVPPVATAIGTNIVPDSAQISFPHPHKYIDKYGETWGYKDKVVLFININRQQVDQPSQINLNFDYAVCDKICLPEHAEFNLNLKAGDLATTISALKFSKFKRQISKPITLAQSAISSATLTASKQLHLTLNSPIIGDAFITDVKHRFYQLASTSQNQQTYNLHGLAIDSDYKQQALTLHYFDGKNYHHIKFYSK